MIDPAAFSPAALVLMAGSALSLIKSPKSVGSVLGSKWMLVLAALLASLSIPKIVVSMIAPCEYFQDTAAAGELLENRSGYPDFDPLRKRILASNPPSAPEALKSFQASQMRCLSELGLNAHPPFLTVITEPLVALMGYYRPILVMNSISLLFVILVPHILARYSPLVIPKLVLVNVTLVLIASQPVLSTLRNGNQSMILAGLVLVGWHFLRQGKEIAGATALALAASLKVYPGIALAYLFWARQKAMAAATMVCASIAAGIVFWHGKEIYFEYARTAKLVASWYTWQRNNYSLHANLKYYANLTNEQLDRPYAVLVAILLISVFIGLLQARKNRDLLCDLSIACACSLMCLITPVVWTHYYSMLTLPYAIVFRYSKAWESPSRLSFLLLLFSLNWLHDMSLGWFADRLGQWVWSLPTASVLVLLAWIIRLANSQIINSPQSQFETQRVSESALAE